MTTEQLKALVAGLAASYMVSTEVPDQAELNEWPKLFGSLMKAFNTPEWKAAVPALGAPDSGGVFTTEQFKTFLAALAASHMVGNQVPSDVELNEWPKVVGSLLKAFNSPEWQALVPAFVG